MSRAFAWLRSEWLEVRLQILLGAVFILAAWPKLLDPPTFAKNIWAYDLLPHALLNLAALVLPAVELCIGLALVLGVWRGAAALLAGGLAVVFFVSLGWNVLAENPVHCSCFELYAETKTCAQMLWEMKREMLLDVGLLLLAAHTLWMRWGRWRVAGAAAPAPGQAS